MAYKPHRDNQGFFPGGFMQIRNRWLGLCSYTNAANGNYALCNIPENTHAWKTAAQANPGFICAIKSACVEVSLGAKNGVAAETYRFCMMKAKKNTANYSADMIAQFDTIDMKPVCDHPSYCKTDDASLYIGQDHHIAYA